MTTIDELTHLTISMNPNIYTPCPHPEELFVNIVEDGFGFYTDSDGNNEIVRRYTFTNQNQLTIQVITYGATIVSIKYPDQCGVVDDVALGFDDIEGYMSRENPYMGAIVGRFANRIAKGHFKINEDHFQLTTNSGEHHLHGGLVGFDKVNWKSDIQGKKLVLTYLSKDGEEGYPGEVLVSATYQMTTDNQFWLEMKATTTKPCPVNLTNHTYFNLAGHAAGPKELLEHLVQINADLFVTTNEESIPTGCLQPVTGTIYDLRIAQKLGSVLHHVPFGGYDQCLCIHKTDSEYLSFIARVVHPESGRTLEIYSNQPGVQFYTANKFPKKMVGGVVVVEAGGKGRGGGDAEPDNQICPIRVCPNCGYIVKDPDFENPVEKCCSEEKVINNMEVIAKEVKIVKLIGKDDADYYFHGAFCLMTENFPDAIHRKNFPNSILRPGEIYNHVVHYKFGLFEDVILEPEDKEPPVDEWYGEGEMDLLSDKGDDDLLDAKLEENGR